MSKHQVVRRYRWWILFGILLASGGVWASFNRGPKPLEVSTERAQVRTITSSVSATGKLHPQTEVRITSEVAGEIVELPVREGQQVRRGELLARINADTLEAQVQRQEAAIRTARARAEQSRVSVLQAERAYRRFQELRAQEFVSLDEIERAETTLREREAAYEAALSQINEQETQLNEALDKLAKATIYAPMDGTISRLSAELGERVVGTGQFEGTEIMRVADLESMEVRIEVTETDIVNVVIGNPVRVEVDALPNETFPASVMEIASSARVSGQGQEQATTFEVRIRIEEMDDRIRPGMTATAEIQTRRAMGVISVPIQSVTVRDRQQVIAALGEPLPVADAPARASQASRPGGTGGAGMRPGGGGGGRPGGGARAGDADRGFNPREARERLQRIVFVVEDGQAKMRRVETGIADRAYIEIKSGLSEGDLVVSGSYSAITRQLQHESQVGVQDGAASVSGGWARSR